MLINQDSREFIFKLKKKAKIWDFFSFSVYRTQKKLLGAPLATTESKHIHSYIWTMNSNSTVHSTITYIYMHTDHLHYTDYGQYWQFISKACATQISVCQYDRSWCNVNGSHMANVGSVMFGRIFLSFVPK